MTDVAVIFLPSWPPERLLPVARAAEAAGVQELWLWEDCFKEAGIGAAGAVLGATERLRVGIGVLPVPLRNVALTAMEVATLARAFPGRLVPGVGHGVQEWMGQVGARVPSPLSLLREHLTALRALLAGERVTVDGRYVHLDDVALDWPPTTVPPVLSAATGPRTLELVGQVADGVVLTGDHSPGSVRRLRDAVEDAWRAAGRAGSPHVVVNVATVTGPGARERLAKATDGPDADLEAGAGAAGDVTQMVEALARYVDAGADTLALTPAMDMPAEDAEEFVRFVGEEVAPLLGR
ncbi:LLM class flavin-dependent oxidoreductase [Luteimicrobium subarcticum]|nr:LLM class flavin-dependent oxidoreductase [Luteimicrobium subarcticum]